MSEAPERIWAWTWDDCSSDNEDERRLEKPIWTDDPPNLTIGTEYVRADRFEQLTAQLAEDADARGLMDARLEQLVAQVDALTAERDAAYANGYSDAETEINQSVLGLENTFLHSQYADAKLRIEDLQAQTMRLSGMVHDLKKEVAISDALLISEAKVSLERLARAEAAEAERDRLRKALKPILRFVPQSIVECRGDKCREPWCASCYGEDAAITALDRASAEAAAARAALKGETP